MFPSVFILCVSRKRFGGTINLLFSLPYEWVYACITYSFGGRDSAKGRTYLQLCENLWRILLLDKALLYLRSLCLIGINEMYFCQSLMTNSNPISINVKSTSIWLLLRFYAWRVMLVFYIVFNSDLLLLLFEFYFYTKWGHWGGFF